MNTSAISYSLPPLRSQGPSPIEMVEEQYLEPCTIRRGDLNSISANDCPQDENHTTNGPFYEVSMGNGNHGVQLGDSEIEAKHGDNLERNQVVSCGALARG